MYTHLEDYIYKLFQSIGITRPDQLDMFKIAALLGVEINYRKNIFRLGNEIILNKNNTLSEQWMDFGHELCHTLRHRGLQLNMNPLYVELQEWKADNFMYHFCVPTFMLENLKLPHTRNETIGLIAKEFNVSIEFAEGRLDRWINQCEGVKLQQMFSQPLTRETIVYARR